MRTRREIPISMSFLMQAFFFPFREVGTDFQKPFGLVRAFLYFLKKNILSNIFFPRSCSGRLTDISSVPTNNVAVVFGGESFLFLTFLKKISIFCPTSQFISFPLLENFAVRKSLLRLLPRRYSL